jgi:hypothetical protein
VEAGNRRQLGLPLGEPRRSRRRLAFGQWRSR